MADPKPQTFADYFKLKIRQIGQWVKPDPQDHLVVTILKTILKSIAVLVLLMVSPVLILALALAFFTAF